jgi:hypothetical protein
MLDWRTLGLSVVAFCATFAVGWWLGLGKAVSLPEIVTSVLPGAVHTSSAQAPSSPRIAAKPPVPSRTGARAAEPLSGKGLTDNDGLRQAVVLRAKAHQRPTCNADPKTLYIIAATKYAEVLMRSAGCNNFPKCPMGVGTLDDVWRLNRSAADWPVAEAMAAVNAAGGLSEKDFRGDVGRAVRVIAGTDFSSGPAPECESPSARRGGTWRIRFRR